MLGFKNMATIKLVSKRDNVSSEAQGLVHFATIKDIEEWQEVIESYHSLQQQFAPKRIFLVLDDSDQADYTSAHTTERKVFNNDNDQVLNNIEIDDPRWNEIYENQVIPNNIAYYAKQLANSAYRVDISQLYSKMRFYSAEDLQAIVKINQSPSRVMGKQIEVKSGMFDSEPLKLALLPNGYFTCDFDPFENFAIITMMNSFGFEFIGLGASLLGFIKTEAFILDKLSELLTILTALYHLDDHTKIELQAHIMNSNYVLLPYSESPSELADYYTAR